MIFLTNEISNYLASIDTKMSNGESLNEEDIKVLLLNLLQVEDSHENE
jgi:hypothetical protein